MYAKFRALAGIMTPLILLTLPQTPMWSAEQETDLSPVTQSFAGDSAASPSSAKPASMLPLTTSRPSETDDSKTVPKGSLQAENGVTYEDDSDESQSWILPETLLRLGLSDNTEFRFTLPNYIYQRDKDEGQLTNNFGDISVGLSHHQELPGKIDIALIPILHLPTGANNISTDTIEPQLRVAVSREFKTLTLESQFDARWSHGKNANANATFTPTLMISHDFMDKLSGFAEVVGEIFAWGSDDYYIQTGAYYTPTKRQQIDFRLGTGLIANSQDILVGFGYSFRIDGLIK
ncbi:putative Outer membrane beta-barrel porin/alpha-amylase [Candidatus Methylobacter favarea]|uniref:Putative Outer membrane beta-barrel porin/alpha-amylase n=2 Tax=Candidatus Methylobacter favarea TaxID=2707345 RepID=A0A8S0WIR0_9GAMM|nr:putative Outer membrane beta-barrel porin/alpha-amylase [Candidatus Methylobacter favarea]